MPKRGQSLKKIERIEDASAVAIWGRDYLRQLEVVLGIARQRYGLDAYNYSLAIKDIDQTRTVIAFLQSELCKFRNGDA